MPSLAQAIFDRAATNTANVLGTLANYYEQLTGKVTRDIKPIVKLDVKKYDSYGNLIGTQKEATFQKSVVHPSEGSLLILTESKERYRIGSIVTESTSQISVVLIPDEIED